MAPTKKQNQVFEALLYFIKRGEMPTVREVGALLGLAPATVMKHLQALEREGLITMSGKSRGIKIADSVRPSGGGPSGGIPVAGRIAAGHPIEAVADATAADDVFSPLGPPERTVAFSPGEVFPRLPIDPRLFAGSGELMALRVAGDSMIEAGILDGDYIIIRRQPTVEEGEIAAVDVAGDVTLKRWQGAATGSAPAIVRLIPANARFEPIEITAADHKEVRVLGKYVGLVRGDIRLS